MLLFKSFTILIIGFVLLIKGADFFVEGSSAVAKRLRIPSMIIGMTIVAMGTSLPECAVSVTASLTGNNSLAISNGRIDGIIFLIIFAGYLLWMIHSAKRARHNITSADSSSAQKVRSSLSEKEIEEVASHINLLPLWKCLIFILGGMIAIKYGGDFVVDGASTIASSLGLSQTLIGLTIIAMGTSLPELVTSIVAARKDEVDMALGNVIGSNIFNILFVLGVAAAISPVGFALENIIDIAFLIIISAITLVFAWTSKEINRKEGIIMLVLYAAYMVYICMR